MMRILKKHGQRHHVRHQSLNHADDVDTWWKVTTNNNGNIQPEKLKCGREAERSEEHIALRSIG
jgi:hypothetical protein